VSYSAKGREGEDVQKMTTLKPPARGRPSADKKRHVIQDIMDAAEKALATKTAKEVTMRGISSAAGANEAMIRYYFGSKEGLLITLLDDFMNHGPHSRSEEILKKCINSVSIGPLVEALCDFYYSRPNIIRMIIVELFNCSSDIKDAYVKKYNITTVNFVKNIIDGMKVANIYRSGSDSTFVTRSLLRLIIDPIIQPTPAGTPQMPPEVGNSDWAAYVTRTIDSDNFTNG
jgi:hypothetical protein